MASAGILSSTNLAQPILFTNQSSVRVRSCSRRRSGEQANSQTGIIAASYARYSSDQQDASSIEQQQRKCREAAFANGHDLRPEFEVADHAVSGSRSNREGLNKLMAAARRGEFQIVYFESLSRLARAFIISQALLTELVYVCRIRVFSTSEGLDSATDGWQLMAMFRSWMHGEFLKQLREAVLRGQEDAVLNDYSVGDWCLGYCSDPIPGSEAGRRGRHPKPRKRISVRDDHAKWVVLIFFWFVTEGQSLTWIAHELVRRGAPKDHRAQTKNWHPSTVVRLLRNRKYVGLWVWGKMTNVTDPTTGKVTQVECSSEDIVQFTRERPDLRIVEDDIFLKAQGMLDHNEAVLAANRKGNGRLRGSTVDLQNPRHLLQSLVKCAACGSSYQVAGNKGQYLKCNGHRTGICTVKTQLHRDRAERMILDQIGDVILRDSDWKAIIHRSVYEAWEHRRRNNPDDCAELGRQLKTAESRVANLLDAIEVGNDGRPDPDLQDRLRTRRSERDDLKRRLALQEKSAVEEAVPPTPEKIEEYLGNLHGTLTSDTPAAAVALRDLIGSIRVEEASSPRSKRKHLRGTFSIKAFQTSPPTVSSIVIDFIDPPKWAGIADRVKELYDRHLRFADITAELRCHRSWPAKALEYWHEQRGSSAPDGRSERKRLLPSPETVELRDRAKALWDGDILVHEIAEKLGCCRDTVTALIKDWHTSRGLEVPSGTSRRKGLSRKSSDKQVDIVEPEVPQPPEAIVGERADEQHPGTSEIGTMD